MYAATRYIYKKLYLLEFPLMVAVSLKLGHSSTASLFALAEVQCLRCAKMRKERVDDKRHNNIVGEDNTHNVEAEEEEANHLPSRNCFISNFTSCPVINYNKIEHDVHCTHHVVEVVAPIVIISKISIKKKLGKRVIRISSNETSIKNHSKCREEIGDKEQEL
mmetsp:Transcript_39622/g.95749  ORF Transcript_39622/g.95749 Transcript_39622/m.95749 type:complete len:163 (-) Transcript_39622:1839-2327(-)